MTRGQAGIPPVKGQNIGSYVNRIFDGYTDNAGFKKNVGSTTIAAIEKVYTVPAGYIAIVSPAMANPTVGSITMNAFTMADAVTTPTNDDRLMSAAAAAGSSTSTSQAVVDEGGSIWGFASAVNMNFTPYVVLIPKAQLLGTWSVRNFKQLAATTDVQVYPISPAVIAAGRWAQPAGVAVIHNTTAGAIVLTTKIQRAADVSAFEIGVQSIAANATTTWLGGNSDRLATLQAGDKVFVNAASAGLNLWSLWCERPLAGI